MLRIPVELYRPILENIEDRGQLLALCVVNRTMQAEVENLLHSHLDFGYGISRRMARSLLKYPRICGLVTSLRIRVCSNFYNDVTAVIHALPNLRALEISLWCSEGSVPPSNLSIITGGCLAQLHSLRIWAWEIEFDEDLISFLAAQRSLRRLEIYAHRPKMELQQIPCYELPCLEKLGAPPEICKWLVQSRKVTEIYLELYDLRVITAKNFPAEFKWLAKMDPVHFQALDMRLTSCALPILPLLSAWLPQLRSLRLFQIKGKEVPELLEHLRGFKCLETTTILINGGDKQATDNEEIVKSLKIGCSRVHTVHLRAYFGPAETWTFAKGKWQISGYWRSS